MSAPACVPTSVDMFTSHLAHMLHHQEADCNKTLVPKTAGNSMIDIMCISVCNITYNKNMVSIGQHMAQFVKHCRLAWLVTLHYDSGRITYSITAYTSANHIPD